MSVKSPSQMGIIIAVTTPCNMKLLCLSIIAVCLVSSLEASPGPIFDNTPVIKYAFQSLNKFFSIFTEKENFVSTQHQQGRQINPQCARDIQETQGQHLRTCNEVLHKFGDSILTSNETDTFCQQRCPSFMLTLYKNLGRDCDYPDVLPPSIKSLLNQLCDQGPDNNTCIVIWNNLLKLSNTSTATVTYRKCFQENEKNSRICNPDCKTAEGWIQSNIGCCYRALVDNLRAEGDVWLLRDDNWDLCNVKEPDACTQVAPIGPTHPPRTPPPRTHGLPMNPRP